MNDLTKLTEPLPSEAVKPHPTKTYLSSIKAIYVTERFNQVFGTGKWSIKVEHVATQPKKADSKAGDMVVVKTTFEVPEQKIYYECYGGNDNADLGDAYKGATTDAITKIGSYLGVGIDVFKGKATPQVAQQAAQYSNQAPAKGWLNDSDFEEMKNKWNAGDNPDAVVKGLRAEGWAVSKKTAELIKDYINQL